MSLLWEIKRYVKHPRCLLGHEKPDPDEIGTDGKVLDYYCHRCSKKIKQVPAKNSLDYEKLARLCD